MNPSLFMALIGAAIVSSCLWQKGSPNIAITPLTETQKNNMIGTHSTTPYIPLTPITD